MSELRKKLLKNTTIDNTATLSESTIFNKKDMIPTNVPMINVALSGSVDGGLTPGLTMLAGPSKHFKSGFTLLLVSAFLQTYKDGIILFYDSEFGTPLSYFTSFEINPESVVHSPITDVEQLKFDIMQQLAGLDREDHVMIIVDSIGNLASKKEVEDALEGKSVADMTRAKQLKSLFRMVVPHLTIKDIPMVVVNHTYKTIEMYSKDVVGGGTGSYYSADNIWILGRQQDKDNDGLNGYHFIINIEKSRFVKEKSKIPITVSFDGGINKWSGLIDIAIDGGFFKKVNKGKLGTHVQATDPETGEILEYKLKDVAESKEFWTKMFAETKFADYLKATYSMSHGPIMGEDE